MRNPNVTYLQRHRTRTTKCKNLRLDLSGSLQKFHPGNIRLAAEFENNTE